MVENTAMSLHNVNTEVDRYIIWPGQVGACLSLPCTVYAFNREYIEDADIAHVTLNVGLGW